MKRNSERAVAIAPNPKLAALREVVRKAEQATVAAKAQAREAKTRLKVAKKEAKDLRRAARKAKRALRKAVVALKKAEAKCADSKDRSKVKAKGVTKPKTAPRPASSSPKSAGKTDAPISSNGKEAPTPSDQAPA